MMGTDGDDDNSDLIPSSFLASLSREEQQEALAAAAAAKRAEERAEQRALERAIREKEEMRRREREKGQDEIVEHRGIMAASRVCFVSKSQRGQREATTAASQKSNNGDKELKIRKTTVESNPVQSAWSEKQRLTIQQSYLGKRAVEREEDTLAKRRKERAKKKITFRFQWDNTDDTSRGMDQDDDLCTELMIKSGKSNIKQRNKNRKRHRTAGVMLEDMPSNVVSLDTVKTKPLKDMTLR